MIDKTWLIRTFDKKILGPVGRDKLINLMRDNKLSESDEVCPGNHHWVYVKERDLLAKMLEAPEISEHLPPENKESLQRRSSDNEKKSHK